VATLELLRKNVVGRKSFAVRKRPNNSQANGQRQTTNDGLALRLLQSVALCRTEESKASHPDWQCDCSYSRDKAEFILKPVPTKVLEGPGFSRVARTAQLQGPPAPEVDVRKFTMDLFETRSRAFSAEVGSEPLPQSESE